MGDEGDQRAVAGDDGGGGEREAGVLHAAVGEARREDQQVVAAPAVGTVEALGGLDHRLGVRELPRRLLDHGLLGVDAAAGAELAEAQITDGEGDEVGRHRLGHGEAVLPVGAALGGVLRAHHRHQVRGHADGRVVGRADAGAVLAGDPAARQDRLGLGEQERLPRRRLLRAEPLQGGGPLGRGVVDDHPVALAEPDRQRRTEDLVVLAEVVLERGAVAVGDRAEVEVPGVEDQLGGCRADPLDVERDAAGQSLPVQVDVEVERHPAYDDLGGAGVGVRVGRQTGHGRNLSARRCPADRTKTGTREPGGDRARSATPAAGALCLCSSGRSALARSVPVAWVASPG